MPPKKKQRSKRQGNTAKKEVTPHKPTKKLKARIPKQKAIGKRTKKAAKPKAPTKFPAAEAVALAVAPAPPCLPLPDAVLLVRSCSKVPDDLPLNTALGQIFASATARNSFCQCVADGVPIDRAKIRCGAGNTLQDVVDDIAC
jgi:hypothetical protein